MTYLEAVLADAPVNYWRLADGVSHILHDIGSAPHHLVLDTSTPLAGGYTGIEAGGGSFYATTLADSGGDGVASSATRSLELWCWQANTRGGSEAALLLHGTGAGNGHFNLYILAGGNAFFRAAAQGVSDPGTLAVREWHHLVGTYDGANVTLYVDGLQVAVAVSVGGANVANAVTIGSLGAGVEPFHGFLSELAEYDYALTAGQVAAHYAAAGLTGPPVSGFLGSYSGTSGGGVSPSFALDAIYNAVHRTI